MTELELEREVRRLLQERGLYGYHHPDSRRAGSSAAGFPDWVVLGKGGVLWRELKDPYRGLSQPQWDVAHLLQTARQDWAIWRPEHLHSGRIAAELDAVVA